MATYKIICSTDGYSASRHSGFSREGVKVMEEGLTLQEAQKALTKLYNRLYDFAPGNWGAHRERGETEPGRPVQPQKLPGRHAVLPI